MIARRKKDKGRKAETKPPDAAQSNGNRAPDAATPPEETEAQANDVPGDAITGPAPASEANEDIRQLIAELVEESSRCRKELIEKIDERIGRPVIDAIQRPMAERLIAVIDRIRTEQAYLAAYVEKDPDCAMHAGCRRVHDHSHQIANSIIEELTWILRDLGAEPLHGPGLQFDPKIQRVVQAEPTTDRSFDGQVCRVLRSGYTWRGTVLRPEEVVVYKHEES